MKTLRSRNRFIMLPLCTPLHPGKIYRWMVSTEVTSIYMLTFISINPIQSNTANTTPYFTEYFNNHMTKTFQPFNAKSKYTVIIMYIIFFLALSSEEMFHYILYNIDYTRK